MAGPGGGGYEVSFIMPAYNEETCIESATAEAIEALRKNTSRFELIVVDDGSTDGTPAKLAKLAAATPELRVIRHEKNIGYGAALRSGFNAATLPLIFYTDSDCQFDAEEITRALPLSNEFDIVAGYRIQRRDSILRHLISSSYNLIVRLLLGIKVRDVNCAFKLFRREVFDRVKIESDNFFVDAEIIAKAHALGLSVHELGVTHHPRRAGSPTVRASNIPETLRELFRIRASIKKQNHKKGRNNGGGI